MFPRKKCIFFGAPAARAKFKLQIVVCKGGIDKSVPKNVENFPARLRRAKIYTKIAVSKGKSTV